MVMTVQVLGKTHGDVAVVRALKLRFHRSVGMGHGQITNSTPEIVLNAMARTVQHVTPNKDRSQSMSPLPSLARRLKPLSTSPTLELGMMRAGVL